MIATGSARIAGLGLLAALAIAANAAGAGPDRPNMVVFITDDQGYLDSTPYGSADIATPNMKRLADAGCRFTGMFVASPSCAPSRAALLTGLMPARNGAEPNHSKPRPEIKKWPAYFQELGYEVVAFGKVSHYKQTIDYGFDYFAHDTFHDHEVVPATIAYLRERAGSPAADKKPLCLMVGTNWPHVPWPEVAEGDDPSVHAPPAGSVDNPETREARAHYAAAVRKADDDLGAVRDAVRELLDPKALFLFTADHGAQWPFGKWNLYDAGLHVPFLAAWPGVIEPGTTSDALLSWVDLLPTLVELAGGTPPADIDGRSFARVLRGETGTHRDRIFGTHSGDGGMNVYPTRSLRMGGFKYILNLHPEFEFTTHIDRAKSVDGRAYWDSWEVAAKTDPRAAAIVNRYHARPSEELYDLEADPAELRNLAADPAQADRLAAMRAEVRAWMVAQGDEGRIYGTPRLLKKPPSPPAGVDARAPRPNIVVILVDDMGFSDLGCYGSEIPTPNLDALAARGLRYTDFTNTSRCCPTRASLLTGLYAHQAGMGGMTEDRGTPGYRGRLNDRCATIAEVLRGAGYFTAMAGKWHVGQEHGIVPWTRGFDRSLNGPAGGFYYADNPRTDLYLNGEHLEPDDPRLPKGWYSTDLWTDYGLTFAEEAMAEGRPFFLYLAYNAPHFPIQAPEADVTKFRGRYLAGWDVLRERRWRRQVASGLVEESWGLSPRPPEVLAWDDRSESEQDRFDQIMATYAAAVHAMDLAVGRLVDRLKSRGVLDDTLILFLSDNGGSHEGGIDGKFERPAGQAHAIAWCGQSWATLENTPFRLYKHWEHEGGIATPLIAHWPAGIPARGEDRGQIGHLIDIMPTCVELAGATYPGPSAPAGASIAPMEGKSLVPTFANHPLPRGPLFWEHSGNRAVREGNWKLVAKADEPWELYDLDADRTEIHDLAGERPEVVRRLIAAWDAWADRVNVEPRSPPKGR